MSQEDRPPSLLRRALPALTLAGAGGLLLVKLDHPSSGALSPAAGALSPLSATAGTPTTSAPAAASDAVAGTVPSTVPAAPATTAAAGPASSACTNDVVGPTVNTRWGPVQVEALLSADGRVCDIQAVQSPGGRGRSLSINQYALPILHDRAVKAAASFNAVSGATITSEGYRSSLQAILDGA